MASRRLIACDCCGEEIIGNFLRLGFSYEFIGKDKTYTVEATTMKGKEKTLDICLDCEKKMMKFINKV